tara:strand:+ start:879 stop:1043 length:165 start_codon:yes stop_codon:yes gene_type:complete
MGRGRVTKIEIYARLIKLKNDLYGGRYDGASEDWIAGAHYQLNSMLDIIDEYNT